MEQPAAQYIFGSVYLFERPEHIVHAFASTNEGKQASCRFDGKAFIVSTRNANAEQTLPVFVKILRSYIEKELDPQRDVFEFSQVKRQPSTEWGKPLQDTILLPDSIDKIGQGTNENQLFAHEPLKRIWKPLLSNTPVEQIFTVDEMGEIGSTTNCQVDFDIDLRGIVVKGEDENSLAQTLSKLQVVEASKACRAAYPGTNNIRVDEGESSYDIRLIPLNRLTDRRLMKLMSGRLSRYKEIKMMTYYLGDTVALPLLDGLKAISSPPGLPLWHSHTYVGYGDERNNIARLPQDPHRATAKARAHPILPNERAREVAQWSVLAASAKEDAFEHIENETRPISNASPSLSDLQSQPKIPNSVARAVRGQAVREQAVATGDANADRVKPTEPQPLITQESGHIERFIGEASSRAQVVYQPNNRSPPPIKPPLVLEDQHPPSEPTTEVRQTWKSGLNAPSGQLIDMTAPVSDASPEASTSATQYKAYQTYIAQTCTPLTSSHASKVNNASRTNESEASNSKSNNAKANDSKSNDAKRNDFKPRVRASPMAFQQARNPVVAKTKAFSFVSGMMETKQAVSESETRRYQRGSNLKKLPPDPTIDSLLIAKIDSSALKFFEIARYVSGKMALEVCLGKVYIDGLHVPKNFKNDSFTTRDWATIFRQYNGNATPTLFTNLLTTSWKDINYILHLKPSKESRLFCDEPQESDVTYEIQFQNKTTGSICILAVQEGGFYTIAKPRELIGALNWHFMKRTWDARLELTQRATARRQEEEYAQTIIRNLYIPANEKLPKLFINTIPKNVTLASVQVRRKTRHACLTYLNTFLQVTEIQDCDVMSNAKGHYRIVARESKQLIEDNRLWWEVSVGHKEAETLLQANESLSIGTHASWTPNIFAGNKIVEEMFLVTAEIVKKINSIGINTRGIPGLESHSGSSKAASAAPSHTSMHVPQDTFW